MSQSVYEQIIRRLSAEKISSPRLEARLLIAKVLKKSPDEISSQTELDINELSELDKLVQKRLQHMPLDKIIGRKEFYKYTFEVNENVLSPRPDTEILVEAAIDIARKYDFKTILDLGTGSGCILCSVLKECRNMHGIGVDKSEPALRTARLNAQNLEIASRCQWLCTDWFDNGFKNNFNTGFDLIVTNPPYIPTVDIDALDKEVKDFDPIAALDGGYDGLDSYRKIAEQVRYLLSDGGFILIEAGINQANDITNIFEKQNLALCSVLKDLAGIPRCVICQKRKV